MRKTANVRRTRKSLKPSKDPQAAREDFLRPCPYLGYGRDQLALYLMSRHAYKIAETQFRRAIWVNPFEPAFKVHLAECLYHMHECPEAREWAIKSLEQDKDNVAGRELLKLIDQRLAEDLPSQPEGVANNEQHSD